jgi:MFS family permease
VAFVAWQALARMFQDGAIMASIVIATEEIPAERRGVAQGVLGLVNQLGAGLAAFVLAGMALVPGGWRGLMLVNLAAVTLLPLLARNVPESRRWMTRAHGSARFPPRYRRRLVAGLALAFLAMSYDVAGFAFTAYVPMTEHGWSAAATSTMIIVAGGLGLPGWWVGGSLADRHGRRPCAVVFLVGLTLAEAAFFLLGSSALWPAFGAMVFCQSGKTAVTRAWVTELFPTAWRATTASWLAAAATLGGITGLALAGAAAPRLGIGLALTLVAVAGPLAAVTAFFLPETHAQDLDAIAHDDA